MDNICLSAAYDLSGDTPYKYVDYNIGSKEEKEARAKAKELLIKH